MEDLRRHVASIAEEIAGEMAARGMRIAYHDDMPYSMDLAEVAVEVICDDEAPDEVQVIRNGHVFEGSGRWQMKVRREASDASDVRAEITSWLAPATDLLMADVRRREEGRDPLCPALDEMWMHPLLRSIIAWINLPADNFTISRPQKSGVRIYPTGVGLDRITRPCATFDLMLERQTLKARLVIIRTGHTIHVKNDGAGIRIICYGQTLPDAVQDAAIGRPLHNLIDHPAFAGARDMPIIKLTQTRTLLNDTETTIWLSPANVRMTAGRDDVR